MDPLEEIVGLLGASVLMGAGIASTLTSELHIMDNKEHLLNAIRPGVHRVYTVLDKVFRDFEEKQRIKHICRIAKDFLRVNTDLFNASLTRPQGPDGMEHLETDVRQALNAIKKMISECNTCHCPMMGYCICEGELCDDCNCGACGSRKLEWGEPCC